MDFIHRWDHFPRIIPKWDNMHNCFGVMQLVYIENVISIMVAHPHVKALKNRGEIGNGDLGHCCSWLGWLGDH